jgi:AcrR family transcriptional regulator
MKSRGESLQDRRQRAILAAATTCFRNIGLRSVTMQDIASEAGMSVGNVYRYFDGKEAIIAALAGGADAGGKEALSLDDTAGDRAFAEELRQLFAFAADQAMGALALELTAEARRNTALASVYASNKAQMTETLVRKIVAAQRRGELREAIDSETLATLVLCACDGLSSRAAFGHGLDTKALADLLSGLCARQCPESGH